MNKRKFINLFLSLSFILANSSIPVLASEPIPSGFSPAQGSYIPPSSFSNPPQANYQPQQNSAASTYGTQTNPNGSTAPLNFNPQNMQPNDIKPLMNVNQTNMNGFVPKPDFNPDNKFIDRTQAEPSEIKPPLNRSQPGPNDFKPQGAYKPDGNMTNELHPEQSGSGPYSNKFVLTNTYRTGDNITNSNYPIQDGSQAIPKDLNSPDKLKSSLGNELPMPGSPPKPDSSNIDTMVPKVDYIPSDSTPNDINKYMPDNKFNPKDNDPYKDKFKPNPNEYKLDDQSSKASIPPMNNSKITPNGYNQGNKPPYDINPSTEGIKPYQNDIQNIGGNKIEGMLPDEDKIKNKKVENQLGTKTKAANAGDANKPNITKAKQMTKINTTKPSLQMRILLIRQ